MEPGDLLFFREDTWHRTQDMDVNRLGLILDILRLPFRDQPHGMAFPVTQRTRQPAVVDRLLRLPMPAYRQMLRNATAPANSVGVGSSGGSDTRATSPARAACMRAEEADALPLNGFVVLRAAVNTSALAAAVAMHAAMPKVDKVEAGGRVYSQQLSNAELVDRAPQLVAQLQARLHLTSIQPG